MAPDGGEGPPAADGVAVEGPLASPDAHGRCTATALLKDGCRIGVGDCALFHSDMERPYVGNIRRVYIDADTTPCVTVSWLYYAEETLCRGEPVAAEDGELFYSFHRDDVPAAAILHQVPIQFLPGTRHSAVPAGQTQPISRPGAYHCGRVWDPERGQVYGIADRDYISSRKAELRALLNLQSVSPTNSVGNTRTLSRTRSGGGGRGAAGRKPIKRRNSDTPVYESPNRAMARDVGNATDQSTGNLAASDEQPTPGVHGVRPRRLSLDGSIGLVSTATALPTPPPWGTPSAAVSSLMGGMPSPAAIRVAAGDSDLVKRLDLSGGVKDTTGAVWVIERLSRIVTENQASWEPLVNAVSATVAGSLQLALLRGGALPLLYALLAREESCFASPARLNCLLAAISVLPVSLDDLCSCKIGRTVARLQGHSDPTVAEASKTLVRLWTRLVECQVQKGKAGAAKQHQQRESSGVPAETGDAGTSGAGSTERKPRSSSGEEPRLEFDAPYSHPRSDSDGHDRSPVLAYYSGSGDSLDDGKDDDNWVVDCPGCGVKMNDGAEMIECDNCGVWVHTACMGVPPGTEAFVCPYCQTSSQLKQQQISLPTPEDSPVGDDNDVEQPLSKSPKSGHSDELMPPTGPVEPEDPPAFVWPPKLRSGEQFDSPRARSTSIDGFGAEANVERTAVSRGSTPLGQQVLHKQHAAMHACVRQLTLSAPGVNDSPGSIPSLALRKERLQSQPDAETSFPNSPLKRKRTDSVFQNPLVTPSAGPSEQRTEPDELQQQSRVPTPGMGLMADWEIPYKSLEFPDPMQRIGAGAYGEVFKARWRGTRVAVKKLYDPKPSPKMVSLFRQEVAILAQLRHPSIVLWMGACTVPPNMAIITEFMSGGSLFHVLHMTTLPIDNQRVLRFAISIAEGMLYLHTNTPPIVHRDLSTTNILIDNKGRAKIGDFGLSRIMMHSRITNRSGGGTPMYMAPETLRCQPQDEAVDIFSFGVILWELHTRKVPWHDTGLQPMQIIARVVAKGSPAVREALKQPRQMRGEIWKTVNECWCESPSERPRFGHILSVLRAAGVAAGAGPGASPGP